MNLNERITKNSLFAGENANEFLAFAALGVYVVAELLFRYSVLSQAYTALADAQVLAICNCVALACAIVSIASKPRPVAVWQGVLIAVALAAMLFSASRTGDYRLVFGLVIVVALAGIDLRRICAVYCCTIACTVVVLALFALTGFAYGNDTAAGPRTAFFLGFADPNTLGAALFSALCALGIFLQRKQLWTVPCALSVIVALYAFFALGSRGSAVALALLAIALLVGNLNQLSRLWDIDHIVFFAVAIAFPLFIMLILFAAVALFDSGNMIVASIDAFLGGRLSYAHDFYAASGGFTHLGRPLPAGVVIDNGYLFMPLVPGLLALYALIATYACAAWRLSKTSRNFLVLAILVITAFYLAIDQSPLFIATGAAFLFLSAAFESGGAERADLDAADSTHGQYASAEGPQDGPAKQRRHSKSDIAIYALSCALLVTLGLAAMYGIRYGNVDESVAPGHIDVYEDGSLLLVVDISEDMTARVQYLNRTMAGKFVLAGAEEDTILYQLRSIEFEDGADSSDAVFFFRMPRSGLQGDFAGPWMTYFSCPSQGAQYSDWIIARENGTAQVGGREKLNAITTQRNRLLEWSSDWTWAKSGDRLEATRAG